MDAIKYEILEDGTITTDNNQISGKNHQSADELLADLADLLGGEVDVKKKQGHAHSHSHSHAHGGHHHHH